MKSSEERKIFNYNYEASLKKFNYAARDEIMGVSWMRYQS